MEKHKGKYWFKCTTCGKEYPGEEFLYLCSDCDTSNKQDQPPSGVLRTIYNYDAIRKSGKDFYHLKANAFLDLLPIKSLNSLPNMAIGNTPLYSVNHLNKEKLPFQLFLKDDSSNPTYSFKDRASALVSALAKENGINRIIAASTGNAGSSLAGICAAQGQEAIILVPGSAPQAKLIQIMMYGATLIPVEGNYDQAFDLSLKATEEFGWFNRNTAFNPFTIEGKKTVSYELFDQLNNSIPDRIYVPVGDGVIISGVYKGFEDLLKLKIIDKIPTIVAVQAEGSSNLVRNINSSKLLFSKSNTIADSIAVDIPRNFFMAKHFFQKFGGEYCIVSDTAIIKASKQLSKNTGLFTEPASASAFAGMLKDQVENKIQANSKVVVLLTGSGLKDLKSVIDQLSMPKPITPKLSELKKLLS
jgi:threonine synthase